MKDRIASRNRIRCRTSCAAAAAAAVAAAVHCSVGTACAEAAAAAPAATNRHDVDDGLNSLEPHHRHHPRRNLRGQVRGDGPASSSAFEMDVLDFSSSSHPSLPQLPRGLDEHLDELNLQDSGGGNNHGHNRELDSDSYSQDSDASNDWLNYRPPVSVPPMQGRIVGGNPVTDSSKYPWSVSLHRKGDHWCGGVLVAPQIIQTAGHCCMSNGRTGADEAILKTLNKHGDTDSVFRTIDPTKCRTHPNYVERGYLHDTCLCPIEGDPVDPEVIAPIEINSDANYPLDPTLDTTLADEDEAGKQVFQTMGYGSLNEQGRGTEWMMEVEVAYVNQDKCLRAFSGRYVKSDMLCAILPGQDACQGDSGGPLISVKENSDKPTLIGTVSWGFGCADPHYPGVYSRCSSYFDWLRANICDLSTSTDSKFWPDNYLACEGKTNVSGKNNTDGTDATSAPTQSPSLAVTSTPTSLIAPNNSTDVGNKSKWNVSGKNNNTDGTDATSAPTQSPSLAVTSTPTSLIASNNSTDVGNKTIPLL